MIEAPLKYQACFFADTSNLRPSVETIPALLTAFADRNLLPSTYHEIGLQPQSPTPKPLPRLRLASSDNEWAIEFESIRINIEKNAIKPIGANLGTFEEFTRDATDFLGRILDRFPRKGHRLALIIRGFLGEMPESRLQDICKRVFVPNDFYTQNPPVGWNSRLLARTPRDIGGKQELLNVITHVKRIRGEFEAEETLIPLDRIEVELDINTYQGNRDPRFEMPAVRAFCSEALKVRDEVLASLKEQLSV